MTFFSAGIATHPVKIDGLAHWPVPVNQQRVTAFSGLC